MEMELKVKRIHSETTDVNLISNENGQGVQDVANFCSGEGSRQGRLSSW